jgi:hypothetical protein
MMPHGGIWVEKWSYFRLLGLVIPLFLALIGLSASPLKRGKSYHLENDQELVEFASQLPQKIVFPNVVDLYAANCSSRTTIHLFPRQWPPQPDSPQLQCTLRCASSDRNVRLSEQLQH